MEWWRLGKPTTLGAASGAVAGLVAITPGAGFVNPMPALLIGVAAGVVCFYAVGLKFRFNYDDSLDVIGVHLVGGIAGSLLLGVLAQRSVNATVPDGLLFGGGGFFLKQAVAVLAVLGFSFVATYIIARAINAAMGLRVSEDAEVTGLDVSLHEEQAYQFSD